MATLLFRFRAAVRLLVRERGVSAVVVMSLCIGLGVNATVFSVVNAVLLKPVTTVQPERLQRIYTLVGESGDAHALAFPDIIDLQSGARSFERIAAYRSMFFNLRQGDETRIVGGELVTPEYFDVLGVQARVGRTFLATDAATAADGVVISDALWRRSFAADTTVLGRAVIVNGQPATIIGVVPPDFRGMNVAFRTDMWVPLVPTSPLVPNPARLTDRSALWLEAVGRLHGNASAEQAQIEVSGIAGQLARGYAATNRDRRLMVSRAGLTPDARATAEVVSGVAMLLVSFLLVIAMVNVGNVLLIRVTQRQAEMALKTALGATRVRLLADLAAEILLLALLGAAGGLLFAYVSGRVLSTQFPELPFPVTLDLTLDRRVFLFTLGLSLLASAAASLMPILRATAGSAAQCLTSGLGRNHPRRSRLTKALLIVETAAVTVLLSMALVFTRSLQSAYDIEPQFDTRNVVTSTFNPALQGFEESESSAFLTQLLERSATLPNVEAASLASILPLSLSWRSYDVEFDTRAGDLAPGESVEIGANIVAPGYFVTVGIPLVSGRDFDTRDRGGSESVAIVNESAAAAHLGGGAAVGQRMRVRDLDKQVVVIGVVKDSKYRTLGEAPRPFIYLPYAQNPRSDMTLCLRVAGQPAAAIAAVRSTAQTINPNVTVLAAGSLAQQVDVALWPARISAILMGLIGGLAALLAVVGVYGTTSYAVSQRAHEFAIRLSLGAVPGQLFRVVFNQVGVIMVLGLLPGVALAFALSRLAASALFGAQSADLVSLAAVTILVGGMLSLASYLPARRAMRADPNVTLRQS